MTREEAIQFLLEANRHHGEPMSKANWARTMVIALECLGLLNFDGEKNDSENALGPGERQE